MTEMNLVFNERLQVTPDNLFRIVRGLVPWYYHKAVQDSDLTMTIHPERDEMTTAGEIFAIPLTQDTTRVTIWMVDLEQNPAAAFGFGYTDPGTRKRMFDKLVHVVRKICSGQVLTRQRGPTVKTQERAKVFERLKNERPEWTQLQVAMKAQEELSEPITEDTVRNVYRAMGWTWERADRIR